MLDMILLGFLMDGEKTGYEIKKLMGRSTNFFFNMSFGSIYPAFRKLEQDSMVSSSETVRKGKLNRIYCITEKGRAAFRNWMVLDPEIARIRDEALLKMFFYTHIDTETIREQVSEYTGRLREQVESLEHLRERLLPHDIDSWQMATLDFGIEYYSFMQKLYTGIMDEKE